MNSSKLIYVYESFTSNDSILMGNLYVDVLKGKEIFSFEYNQDWLKNNKKQIYPNLYLYKGRQFFHDNNTIGIFSDSAPDRWGRTLMREREARLAEKENREQRTLFLSDYLLGVYDETRMGALRFKLDKEGEFLSNDKNDSTPPWTMLRTLEHMAYGISGDDQVPDDWIEQLLKPGSSLGGARPKANVMDQNGNLWIAKFPAKNDDIDVGAWEMVASELARLCELNMPETKIEEFSKNGHTFLTKRFDRKGEQRIYFASAMSLLGKNDGEEASYLELVDYIKTQGVNVKGNLLELWKRIVFNMAIRNTDDHLRNHGFILNSKGWELSPLYDVNPIPYGNYLALNIDYNSGVITKDKVLSVCEYFDLELEEAKKMLKNICKTVNENWERIAVSFGLSRDNINNMRPAFAFSKENA